MDLLVAFLHTDEDYPEDYQFQSPLQRIKAFQYDGRKYYRMDIIAFRNEETDKPFTIPLISLADKFPRKPKADQPLRGVCWLTGHLSKLEI